MTTSKKAQASGGRAPSDHQAKAKPEQKVRNVQVLPGEVRLDWDGHEYVLAPEVIDDVDFILELEQDKNLSAIVRLLGAEQWATFKSTHIVDGRTPMSEAVKFLEALLEQLQKVQRSGN